MRPQEQPNHSRENKRHADNERAIVHRPLLDLTGNRRRLPDNALKGAEARREAIQRALDLPQLLLMLIEPSVHDLLAPTPRFGKL